MICQESDRTEDGINKIVAMDDNLLWTASGTSSIRRWLLPGRRATRATTLAVGFDESGADVSPSSISQYSPPHSLRRSSSGPHSKSSSPSPFGKGHRSSMSISVTDPTGSMVQHDLEREGEETWYGIPFESLVKLTSPNESFGGFGMSRGRDPEIATLYSAASVMSVPRLIRSPLQSIFPTSNPPRSISPVNAETLHSRAAEETLHPLRTARIDYEEREVASDAVPLHTVPDEVIHGDHGLVRSAVLNDRLHALTVNTAGEVAVWNLIRGVCLGRYACEDIAEASFCGSSGSGSVAEQERSPREALETVKERIEGEAVVVSWASVDTKTGLLSVHLNDRCFESEIYADEAGYSPDRHFGDEMRSKYMRSFLRFQVVLSWLE